LKNRILVLLAAGLATVACRQDMHNQPKYKPLAASTFFGDGRASRPVIEDTVARGHLRLDDARFTGKVNGADIEAFPFPITRADLQRGQERFNIYCSPCHGRLGDGQGMIVKRGYRQPPSFHIDRLRNAPIGHYFDVETNGFGAMPSYASRVPVDDRWRIISYIRALQYSQGATVNDVPADKRGDLDKSPQQQSPTGSEAHEQRETNQPPTPSPARKGTDTGRATEK
jgi:mono/diheme cytochrome c family protein